MADTLRRIAIRFEIVVNHDRKINEEERQQNICQERIKKMKERLDVLLVKKGLAPSREKAKTLIMEGKVFVDGEREDKAGAAFLEEAAIEIHGSTLQYVSRGGLKLEKAMKQFDLCLKDKDRKSVV